MASSPTKYMWLSPKQTTYKADNQLSNRQIMAIYRAQSFATGFQEKNL